MLVQISPPNGKHQYHIGYWCLKLDVLESYCCLSILMAVRGDTTIANTLVETTSQLCSIKALRSCSNSSGLIAAPRIRLTNIMLPIRTPDKPSINSTYGITKALYNLAFTLIRGGGG